MTNKTTKREISERLAEVAQQVADLDRQVADLDRQVTDLNGRLRRLEAWAADGETGPPIYPTGTTAQEDDQTRKAVVDHEARLRRLEVWVAGTTTTKQGGAAEYPLAAMVKPWADPEEVARLLASNDEDGLARLIYADPFAGLPGAAGDRPAAQVVRESYPLRLGGKGFFVADTSSYPKDLGYLLRSVEEKPEAVLHSSLEKEGLLFTPPHQEGLYQVEAVWANTPDPDDPPRWKTTLVAVTIRLDHFQALQEPTTDDNPDPFF